MKTDLQKFVPAKICYMCSFAKIKKIRSDKYMYMNEHVPWLTTLYSSCISTMDLSDQIIYLSDFDALQYAPK